MHQTEWWDVVVGGKWWGRLVWWWDEGWWWGVVQGKAPIGLVVEVVGSDNWYGKKCIGFELVISEKEVR
jgi:hypothetical protein